jgi:hypothetical protein
MSKIVERIINDTRLKVCKWSCGSHSDIWSAVGPGYTLEQQVGGIWYTYFRMSVAGGSIVLKIGLGDWNRLRGYMTDPDLSPEAIYERME